MWGPKRWLSWFIHTTKTIWLVVWLPFLAFSHILGIVIPIDELIFLRGVAKNHQPVEDIACWLHIWKIIAIGGINSPTQRSEQEVWDQFATFTVQPNTTIVSAILYRVFWVRNHDKPFVNVQKHSSGVKDCESEEALLCIYVNRTLVNVVDAWCAPYIFLLRCVSCCLGIFR